MKASVFFALALIATVHAQELLPELQPLAAKHKANVATIESQKATALAHAREVYVAALEAAEKSATTTGQLPIVATLTKEREAVNSGKMSPTLLADLPKSIQAQRKSCEDAVARVSADFTLRQQRVDADYLRALAALQSRTLPNSELAKQLAEEKASLLQGAAGKIAKNLYETRWTSAGVTLTFHTDESVSGSNGGKGTWKLTTDNKLLIQWPNGKPAEKWSYDPSANKITQPNGDIWRTQ